MSELAITAQTLLKNNERLQEECKELKAERETLSMAHDQSQRRIKQLEKELLFTQDNLHQAEKSNKNLRETLEFYANKYNYSFNKWTENTPEVNRDGGERARRELGETK